MDQWYYTQGGQQVGPVSADVLRQKLASGEVQAGESAWKDGMANWAPIHTIPELAGMAGGSPYATTPINPTPYYPQQTGQPVFQGYAPPSPAASPGVDDSSLTAIDWVVCLICAIAGCIMGIVYVAQGKSKGWKVIGLSILSAIVGGFIQARFLNRTH